MDSFYIASEWIEDCRLRNLLRPSRGLGFEQLSEIFRDLLAGLTNGSAPQVVCAAFELVVITTLGRSQVRCQTTMWLTLSTTPGGLATLSRRLYKPFDLPAVRSGRSHLPTPFF